MRLKLTGITDSVVSSSFIIFTVTMEDRDRPINFFIEKTLMIQSLIANKYYIKPDETFQYK